MTGPALDRAIQRLEARGHPVRKVGTVWRARCTHEGAQSPDSLVILSSDSRIRFHCHSRGCTNDEVREALGLTVAEQYHWPKGDAVAQYRYDDGRTVYRRADKSFGQTGARGTPTLYRAFALAACIGEGWPVYVVEGEEDVHALEAVDECATCAPMGAANVGRVDVEPLRGAEVVAVVDRDEAGHKWARAVADKLAGVAVSVRFVRAAVGKDASDHLAAGLGVDDFRPYDPDDHPVPEPAPAKRAKVRGWTANLWPKWLTDADYQALSLGAWWLGSWSLPWSIEHGTDGHIPAKAVAGILSGPMSRTEADGAASELVAAGLWAIVPGGFQVVGWEDDQPTTAEMEAKRQSWRRAQERHRGVMHDSGVTQSNQDQSNPVEAKGLDDAQNAATVPNGHTVDDRPKARDLESGQR